MTSERNTKCPHCGRVNELHSGPEPGSIPKPGDVSLCWECGEVAFYTKDGGLRSPTLAEWKDLLADPEIQSAREAIRQSKTPDEANERRWRGL